MRRALRGSCKLPVGSRLLVAVSGGADSTALLLALDRLASESGLALHAAHLHHGLRGAEADRDQAFVRALCAKLGVPLTTARWDTRARMRRRGISGQAGLRTLRREFLERAATRAGASAIATAHTADDQLETLLMRLLRGTGFPGLGGMSARRGRWIRPLLAGTRADIEADLTQAGQPWREDGSNRDLRHARNRVRHGVVPALLHAMGGRDDSGRERGALAQRVAGTAAELRSARRAIEWWADRILPRATRIQGTEIALDSQVLASYPDAVRRMVLRRIWKRLGHAQPGLTYRHLEALEKLRANPRGGSQIELPAGFRAQRDQNWVVFRRSDALDLENQAPAGWDRSEAEVALPDRGRFRARALEGQWLSGTAARRRLCSRGPGEELFAAEAVRGALKVRTGRSDEWFIPFGRRRPRRLGEFLSKERVPRALRAHPTVVADEGGILWVIGVRRSARALLGERTRKALWIRAESHD